MVDITKYLASRTARMSQNSIREILKVTSRPEIISLAGGLPAPNSFPIDEINILHNHIMNKYGPAIFQYGLTEGFIPFREAICTYLGKKGIQTAVANIVITSGSQGALDAVGKLLLDKGDILAVESPTYLGAMTAFNPYEPTYVQIETDSEGIIPESLEAILKNQKVKLIYLNPTFQNPTGRTLSESRREMIANIIVKYNAIAIEDDPYGDIRYRGLALQSLKARIPDNIIYLGTFSKIFAPGFRLGFAVAPSNICDWMTMAKQGVDLHSNSYGQALAAEYITEGYYDKHLPKIINIYKPKQEAMLRALETYFPNDFTWTKPDGGMFIWVQGPNQLDTFKAYPEAIKRNVAYVPGQCFYAKQGDGQATMRLNFTNASIENITEAIRRLADMFKQILTN